MDIAERDVEDVPKVPYERVSAGQVQDDLRHRVECAERELAELEARRREVDAVHDAAVAGLEQFNRPDGSEPVRDESREAEHERLLRARLDEAEGQLEVGRTTLADWQAVREAAAAGLKALEGRRKQDDDGGAAR